MQPVAGGLVEAGKLQQHLLKQLPGKLLGAQSFEALDPQLPESKTTTVRPACMDCALSPCTPLIGLAFRTTLRERHCIAAACQAAIRPYALIIWQSLWTPLPALCCPQHPVLVPGCDSAQTGGCACCAAQRLATPAAATSRAGSRRTAGCTPSISNLGTSTSCHAWFEVASPWPNTLLQCAGRPPCCRAHCSSSTRHQPACHHEPRPEAALREHVRAHGCQPGAASLQLPGAPHRRAHHAGAQAAPGCRGGRCLPAARSALALTRGAGGGC